MILQLGNYIKGRGLCDFAHQCGMWTIEWAVWWYEQDYLVVEDVGKFDQFLTPPSP